MQLTPGTVHHGFSIESNETLAEINGNAIIAAHSSGAKLLYLQNDDNNKSFAIGFRTPPKDDTGVFHILEHSVLCGSRRFPVKEPFVDLLKGSMQTFLNAMTFPDKTLYPVASTNEQDLFNLMDVYLDAVFHPRIYEKRAIFEQEGWHFELEGADDETGEGGELVYNGVVYNEMKGALSDASSVLFDEIQAQLFPDTPYAFESGGTPRAIPTLAYEDYLDEHRRHYRTDNSYIVLYGNLDIDRALSFLDERYLTPVRAEQDGEDKRRAESGLPPLRPRTLALQAPRAAGFTRKTMDTAPENACAAWACVIGTAKDRTRVMATDILLDALFGSNEAPLKRSLLDAGVAHEITAFVVDAVLQPFAVVQASMPAEGCGETLQETVRAHAEALLDEGLDLDLVEAALSHAEFQMREHEMGISDGVVNAMTSLSGWLYDDDAATDYLRYGDAFAELRASLSGDYFQNLARDLFLNGDHTASVEIVPTPGISDDDTAGRLAEIGASLASDDRQCILDEEKVLRDLQEAPDSPEAIATLPRLSVADIGNAPEEPAYRLDDSTPVTCLRHDVATNGIAYAYRYFDENCLEFDELPYVAILAMVLGKLDTKHHSASEIDVLTQGKLGNLSFITKVFEHPTDISTVSPKFMVSASALSDNVEWLAGLPREIMLETDFSDTAKILDILKQRKISAEQAFTNSGHTCAMARVRSYYTPAGVMQEQMGNVGFYRFVCDAIEHFDERAGELTEKLADIAARLFCDNRCIISFGGTDEDLERFWKAKPECGRMNEAESRLVIPEPVRRNEAFITPSDVCFASAGWDWRLYDGRYTGAWNVAARALGLDYLWNEVRVKGGAYGVGYQAQRGGNMRFYSYRDPHLDETLERFRSAADWLAAFDPSTEDLEGYIVATVASIDAPVKPRGLIRRQASELFSSRAPEERRIMRQQAIETDIEIIRKHADDARRIMDENAVCVFGSKAILESSSAQFEVIPLVG